MDGRFLLVFAVLSGLAAPAPAQTQTQTPAAAEATAEPTAAAQAPAPNAATPDTPEANAWNLLTSTVTDTKHVDNCIQGLAALGTMGANARAAELIAKAMKDPELDIRVAAVLAAAQTKNPRLFGAMREALNDPEPQVAYVAATSLWKLKDHSGQDVLSEIATGNRRANATLMHGARHTMSRDMHSPSALAKIGASEGASLLLGPFGVGVTAVEYARKNGGDSARAESVDLLAEEHSPEVHKQLLGVLGDKDPAVRAAAAKGLGQWSDPGTAKALEPLIDDSKLPVRLTGAAAYLRASSPATHRTPAKTKP